MGVPATGATLKSCASLTESSGALLAITTDWPTLQPAVIPLLQAAVADQIALGDPVGVGVDVLAGRRVDRAEQGAGERAGRRQVAVLLGEQGAVERAYLIADLEVVLAPQGDHVDPGAFLGVLDAGLDVLGVDRDANLLERGGQRLQEGVQVGDALGVQRDRDDRPRRHERLARGVQDAGPLGPHPAQLQPVAGVQLVVHDGRLPDHPPAIAAALSHPHRALVRPRRPVRQRPVQLDRVGRNLPGHLGLADPGHQQRRLGQVAGQRVDLVGHLRGGDRRAVRRDEADLGEVPALPARQKGVQGVSGPVLAARREAAAEEHDDGQGRRGPGDGPETAARGLR
jgi:hypothetical protein